MTENQPETEPTVTLRPEAHAESVERHFLPAVGLAQSADQCPDRETPESADYRARDGVRPGTKVH